MTYQCPVCQRSFAEPGFCPYDGKQLVERAAADKPTVLSSYMQAQSEADTIAPDAHAARDTTPGVGDAATNKLRSLSAHDGQGAGRDEVIETMRKRINEYDRLIGETLDGRYFVQRKIGEGGMGVVFAVRHAVIERPLAIKVLKREVMRDKAVIQRFIQEAKAASRIGHPNIVDVTDFGKTPDGMTYSVMEYVDGTTLSKTIKNSAPMSAERAVRIAAQIARALAAAHGKGIVHRDLKPENVFLIDRDGRPDFVKIVDFGIAKVQPIEGTEAGPRLTRVGSVFGTPEYMAPEQAAGRGDTDHRVDVYALGVILYEMVVGKVPHKSESMIRTIAMQMLDPVVPPSQVDPGLAVPPALEAIVMRALEKDRDKRYHTMNELLTALEAIQPKLAAASLPLTLTPLPPGADPDLTPVVGVKAITDVQPAPRRPKPATRQLHEPQFVAPGTPVSFSHVYDEPDAPPEPRRRWPAIVAALLTLAIGAGGTIFVISKLQEDETVITAVTGDDAAVISELRDAGSEPPVDAPVIAELPVDAGTRVVTVSGHDAGVGTTRRPPAGRSVTIEVLTRPGEANVYIGANYRGPSGVRITEPYGTKRKVECKTERMKGSVEVVFDGRRDSVMCTATRDRFCVPGLKNPYDDCEEDPNGDL